MPMPSWFLLVRRTSGSAELSGCRKKELGCARVTRHDGCWWVFAGSTLLLLCWLQRHMKTPSSWSAVLVSGRSCTQDGTSIHAMLANSVQAHKLSDEAEVASAVA